MNENTSQFDGRPVVDSSSGSITYLDVKQALATQSRVIKALILREMLTRYGEHKIGFLWALLQPVVMTAMFVAIFIFFRSREMGGIPIGLFILTGFVPFTLFKGTMQQMQGSINSNKALLGFPQVTTFDVITARAILEIATMVAVFAILLIAADLLGFDIRIEDPIGVAGVIGLLALLGAGLGFTFASIAPLFPSIQQLTSVALGRPLLLSSGILFTAEAVPAAARDWLLYNPVLHMMELLRGSFFHEFESPYGSWYYATVWAVSSFAFGLILHQALQKRATIGL